MATYTKQPPSVKRVQLDISPDASPSQMVQAFTSEDLVNDVNPLDVIDGAWGAVNFDAKAAPIATEHIVAAGADVTYTQLLALIKQAIIQRL